MPIMTQTIFTDNELYFFDFFHLLFYNIIAFNFHIYMEEFKMKEVLL